MTPTEPDRHTSAATDHGKRSHAQGRELVGDGSVLTARTSTKSIESQIAIGKSNPGVARQRTDGDEATQSRSAETALNTNSSSKEEIDSNNGDVNDDIVAGTTTTKENQKLFDKEYEQNPIENQKLSERFNQLWEHNWDELIDKKALLEASLDDAIYGTLIRILKGEIHEQYITGLNKVHCDSYFAGSYKMKNGLLYNIRYAAFMIPKSLRYSVCQYFHCALTNMHQGSNRMLTLMQNRVHWIGIADDVKAFCEECFACRVGKRC